jgi:4-hydroxy-tetrahydrodipicolinate synthase
MTNSHLPGGLWTPIITPFGRDGSIGESSLDRLARRLLSDGVAGLVALGTTGEPATLDQEERLHVAQICAKACADAGRGLIIGAGSNSTAGTIREIRHLTSQVEASAALVVVPYYTRPSEAAVVDHFRLVADESPIPLVMYNIPYRTGLGLGADALLDAAKHPNIVGIKQSVGCLDADTLQLLHHAPDDFSVFAGDDAFIAPTMLLGGAGAISAASHLHTHAFVQMCAAASDGDVAGASWLAGELHQLVTSGFTHPSPALWKHALAELGEITTSELRRPLTPAPGAIADGFMTLVRGFPCLSPAD